MENYRPVSDLIGEDQHGFRANRSTETAAFELVEFIHKELECNRIVVALFFDLSRAFDTLNQDFIQQKLYCLGIRGNTLALIMSFLSERRLLVKINDCLSDDYEMNIGTPQGSVLAPLLFLLFVNDLSLPGVTVKFADDTSVAISAENEDDLQEKVKRVCDEMSHWCFKNCLILNEDKTVRVHFYGAYPKATIENDASTVKFLGTYLDAGCSWETQIDHLCKKLNKAFFALLKLKYSVPVTTLIMSYYALVYPHLSYNIILWGQAVNIDRVFIAQKRIMRLIFGIKVPTSCKDYFINNNLLTLASIYILKCSVYVFKYKKKFKQLSHHHSYATRHGTNLLYPRHTTTRYEKSPYYSCVRIFNHLPSYIREETVTNKFRKQLKEYLIANAFYTFKEFMDRSTT